MPRPLSFALLAASLLGGCLHAPPAGAPASGAPSLTFSSIHRLTAPDADCPEEPRVDAGAREVTVAGRLDIPQAGGRLDARPISTDGHLTLLLHTLTAGTLAMVETRCYRARIDRSSPDAIA